MPRNVLRATALAAIFATSALFAAGPADLLDQAIKENESEDRSSAKADQNPEIRRLVAEADRMIDAEEFAKAVALYEKAYRLDPNNRAMYARLLVAKRSAGTMTEQDREALAIIEEEQAAEVNQVYRRVRLLIIQAKQAIRGSDVALAQERIASADAELASLPRDVDVSPYQRQLTTLRNSMKSKAARTSKSDRASAKSAGSAAIVTRKAGDSDEPTLMDTGDETTVSTTTEVITTTDNRSSYEFAESGEIIDVDDALYGEFAIHAYERELATALARQRATQLIDNQVAAFPPPAGTDMVYPADWAEKTARRAEYRDGAIHEGQPFTGADGQTYQTVIYDLAELVHPVPNFYATYPGSAYEQHQRLLDRQYLRERSMIFNGWPEDLAAGLPLLHFFGGIDNNAISTRTDPNETARIMMILNNFVNSQNAGTPGAATQNDPN